METRERIFIACALGAGIGTLIALQINGFFWWIGAVIGSMIGFLSYQYKEIVSCAVAAWREVSGWKPDKDAWKICWLSVVVFLSEFSSALVLYVIGLSLSANIEHKTISQIFFTKQGEITSQLTTMIMVITTVPSVIIIMTTALLSIGWAIVSFSSKTDHKGSVMELKKIIKYSNPLAVFVYWPAIGLLRTPAFLLKTARATRDFARTFFFLIYSDERLLCGVWSFVGAVIGYFSASVVIGALAGGIFGVANYEIVSKRILKLA